MSHPPAAPPRDRARAFLWERWDLVALIVLGDDRLIAHTVVQGQIAKAQPDPPLAATIGA